jgi:hypothetical protein
MVEKEIIRLRCPWGSFNFKTGFWNYNPNLKMTFEEQLKSNVRNGYMCEHGWAKSYCTTCGGDNE